MKLIAIPNFGERISPRIDYAESLQLVAINEDKILKQECIKIITHSNLERINLLVNLKPNIVICDGISELLYNKLIENNIEVLAWIHGNVKDIINSYLNGKLEKNISHDIDNRKG